MNDTPRTGLEAIKASGVSAQRFVETFPRPPVPGEVLPKAEFVPLVEHEFIPQPTAWQSIPGAVRFAVWLWAITVIIGFVVGVVMLVFWLITAGALISQM